MSQIQRFHAHVYFDQTTQRQATQLCQEAGRQFDLTVGRIHTKPVGPHPCWSCQLAFETAILGDVLSWLALNRQGLVIFIHPQTGNDLKDHTDHAIWMGAVMPLKLEVFTEK